MELQIGKLRVENTFNNQATACGETVCKMYLNNSVASGCLSTFHVHWHSPSTDIINKMMNWHSPIHYWINKWCTRTSRSIVGARQRRIHIGRPILTNIVWLISIFDFLRSSDNHRYVTAYLLLLTLYQRIWDSEKQEIESSNTLKQPIKLKHQVDSRQLLSCERNEYMFCSRKSISKSLS